MLENLFTFPIVIRDGEEEEKKQERNTIMALSADDYKEVFIGEAEVPYFDFLGVIDKWGYTEESREKARNGIFDHCYVMFATSGTFLVPWNKKKFKEKLIEFTKSLPPILVKIPIKKQKDEDSNGKGD